MLPLFKGSEILNIFFRCMGAKIGKRVMMESITVGDWDLITIGDDTVVRSSARHACLPTALRLAPHCSWGHPLPCWAGWLSERCGVLSVA